MKIREGVSLKGLNILIFLDVIGTGYIANMLIDLAEREGANIKGIACIVDINGSKYSSKYPIIRILTLEKPLITYHSINCPLCEKKILLKTAPILPWRYSLD